MMNDEKDLIIFVLSFGREKVPTLKHIADKSKVIILTSEDNDFKDAIKSEGAEVMIFDKRVFRGQGLEMMNEESVPQRRSAVYGYNYAINWGRDNGYKYVLVLDDDYINTFSINDRIKSKAHPMIDLWARHVVQFLKKYPFIGACCALNTGQVFAGAVKAYLAKVMKRQLMNTIIFNTNIKHYFVSLGNGDYCDSAMLNTFSRSLVLMTCTLVVNMETIKEKRHKTIDYGNLFHSRYSAQMLCPAYVNVRILEGNRKTVMSHRFNTFQKGNNAPKIVSL